MIGGQDAKARLASPLGGLLVDVVRKDCFVPVLREMRVRIAARAEVLDAV
jgi:hypothetical protein